jgi:hypothetical protein
LRDKVKQSRAEIAALQKKLQTYLLKRKDGSGATRQNKPPSPGDKG